MVIFFFNEEFLSSISKIGVNLFSVFHRLWGKLSSPYFDFFLPNDPHQFCSDSLWHQRVHPDITEYQKLAWQSEMCLSWDDSLCEELQRVSDRVAQKLSLGSEGTKPGGRQAGRAQMSHRLSDSSFHDKKWIIVVHKFCSWEHSTEGWKQHYPGLAAYNMDLTVFDIQCPVSSLLSGKF